MRAALIMVVSLFQPFTTPHVKDNWVYGLRRFDPAAKFFDYSAGDYGRILDLIKDEREVVFEAVYRSVLKPKDLEKHAGKGVFVHFFSDDDWQFYSFSRYIAQYYHASVTTYGSRMADYARHGFKAILSQWACNEEIFHPVDAPKLYDVTFIGGPHSDRVEKIRHLLANGVKVRVFGKGWHVFEDLKDCLGGFLSTEDMVKTISQSRINLNFSMNSVMTGYQVKGRTFEIAACRSFQITEDTEDIRNCFAPGKEIDTFSSKDELLEKIRHYLEHEGEREAIAENAYRRAVKEHTWLERFRRIFSEVDSLKSGGVGIRPHLSRTPVKLIYRPSRKRPDSLTLRSINRQTLPDVEVIFLTDRPLSVPSGLKYPHRVCSRKVVEELDLGGCYLAFIADGESWEPQKLQFQAFSLDHDKVDGIPMNLCGFGMFMRDPEREEARYYLRWLKHYAKRPDLIGNMVIPSAVMLDADAAGADRGAMLDWLAGGGLPETVADLVRSEKYRTIDIGQSLARISDGAFKRTLTAMDPVSRDVVVRNALHYKTSRVILGQASRGRLIKAARAYLIARTGNRNLMEFI